jgi:hypothetical protein
MTVSLWRVVSRKGLVQMFKISGWILHGEQTRAGKTDQSWEVVKASRGAVRSSSKSWQWL